MDVPIQNLVVAVRFYHCIPIRNVKVTRRHSIVVTHCRQRRIRTIRIIMIQNVTYPQPMRLWTMLMLTTTTMMMMMITIPLHRGYWPQRRYSCYKNFIMVKIHGHHPRNDDVNHQPPPPQTHSENG